MQEGGGASEELSARRVEGIVGLRANQGPKLRGSSARLRVGQHPWVLLSIPAGITHGGSRPQLLPRSPVLRVGAAVLQERPQPSERSSIPVPELRATAPQCSPAPLPQLPRLPPFTSILFIHSRAPFLLSPSSCRPSPLFLALSSSRRSAPSLSFLPIPHPPPAPPTPRSQEPPSRESRGR